MSKEHHFDLWLNKFPNSKIYIVKTNANGEFLWSREINIGGHNLGNSAIELDDDDSAILTIHGKALLCNIIDLCSDIANSIAYGGYTPQNAGELFKSYFKPKHDAAGIPQPRYLS